MLVLVVAAAQRQEDTVLNRRVFIGLLSWLSVLTLLTLACLLLFWFAADDDDVASDMRRDYIADRKFHWRHDNRRYVFPRISTVVSGKNETEQDEDMFNENPVVCRDIRVMTTPPATGTTATPTLTENVRL